MPRRAFGPTRWGGGLWCAIAMIAVPALGADPQGRIDALIHAADLGEATCSLYVADLDDGEMIVQRQPDRSMIPASNMKLVTTATALAVLGGDFHFSTKLLQRGDDLIVVGDGDPGFGDARLLAEVGLAQLTGNGNVSADGKRPGLEIEHLLARWVDVVGRAGVKRVGTLFVDDREFDRNFVHPNWPRDQRHLWYCAQVAGLNFNDNCLDVYATPASKIGRPPMITTRPFDAPVDLTNLARTGRRNAFWATRDPDSNRITLRGQVKHRLLAPIHVTVDDPPLFFARTLRDRLQAAGIEVNGVRRVDGQDDLRGARTLAEVRTPIEHVLQRCNEQSQNLFAEALLKKVGRRVTGEPGSWTSGAAAGRMFLSRALGPEARALAIDDGCGLSRENRVTTRLLVRLLTYMNDDPALGSIYRESLAVGGEEGTLTRRFTGRAYRQTTIEAKSGYIRGVIALSGYLSHDQREVAFSIILNDYPRSAPRGKQLIDQIVQVVNDYLVETTHPAAAVGG